MRLPYGKKGTRSLFPWLRKSWWSSGACSSKRRFAFGGCEKKKGIRSA
jgi:hypothetical protein